MLAFYGCQILPIFLASSKIQWINTVDGRNPTPVFYPIIYRVLYILGGCFGFLPSTVGCGVDFKS